MIRMFFKRVGKALSSPASGAKLMLLHETHYAISKSMSIWARSARAVLTLFLTSTGRKYYITEVQRETGMSYGAVHRMLEMLAVNEILIREKERASFDSACRRPRIYYSLALDPSLLRLDVSSAEADWK